MPRGQASSASPSARCVEVKRRVLRAARVGFFSSCLRRLQTQPHTQSHGVSRAWRACDPAPRDYGCLGLHVGRCCRCRRRGWRDGCWGCSQAGGVLLGGQCLRSQMRLQVPQLADHAHLRFLQAFPGRGERNHGARQDSPCPYRGRACPGLPAQLQAARAGWRACVELLSEMASAFGEGCERS